MITITNAHFLTSASRISECPAPTTSEIVMLGRSNVGKSTFINTLLESNLAKSSSTPGKTRLINFFTSIWHDQEKDLHIPISLIDLPGIGYAKVSKQELTLWQRNLWEFLQQRSSIKLFIHLIDARHQRLAIDSNLASQIQAILRGDQILLPIYTKADKLTKNDLAKLKQKAALITTNNATIARTIYRPKSPQDPTLLDMIRERIFYALLGDISTDMPNKG